MNESYLQTRIILNKRRCYALACFTPTPRVAATLQGCGYRITIAPEAILEILSKTNAHLSADEIYMKIRPTIPHIGLATVYRTLEVLTQMNVVHKLAFGNGRARYELAEGLRGGSNHHHLVCTQCTRIINYTDFADEEVTLLQRVEKALAEKHHFKMTHHLIQFHGVCQECQKKSQDLSDQGGNDS